PEPAAPRRPAAILAVSALFVALWLSATFAVGAAVESPSPVPRSTPGASPYGRLERRTVELRTAVGASGEVIRARSASERHSCGGCSRGHPIAGASGSYQVGATRALRALAEEARPRRPTPSGPIRHGIPFSGQRFLTVLHALGHFLHRVGAGRDRVFQLDVG